MALKLRARTLAQLSLRYDLPAFLADGADCFIEVDARPGGAVNKAYIAKGEELLLKAQIAQKELDRINDPAKNVRQGHKEALKIARDRFGVMYDTCIVEWRTNILNGDDPLECNRENFLALADERIPEISDAFIDMEKQIVGAGESVAELDGETEKN